jgi:hypothetical protein
VEGRAAFDLSGAPFGLAPAPGLPAAALALLLILGRVTPDFGRAADGTGREAFRASALSVA